MMVEKAIEKYFVDDNENFMSFYFLDMSGEKLKNENRISSNFERKMKLLMS